MSAGQSASPFRLHALANVRPLRPVRVLLAGREPRYLRAIAFLLERRGYQTRRSNNLATVFSDVEAFDPDLVILVESESFADTVGQAVSLLGLNDRLRVIVSTSRDRPPGANRLRFIEKWCPFELLAEAVERAWAEIPSIAARDSLRN